MHYEKFLRGGININNVKGYLTVCTNEYFSALITSNFKDFHYRVVRDNILFWIEKEVKENQNIKISFNFKDFIIQNHGKEYFEKLFKYITTNNKIRHTLITFSKFVFLSREELVLYVILYDYFLENEDNIDNGFLTISLKEIHCRYRNATLKRFNKIDENTRKTYFNTFTRLSSKNIQFDIPEKENFTKYSINQALLSYSLIKNDSGYVTAIKFSLGAFGEYLKFRKRNCGLLPPSVLHLGFNQTVALEIGLYIVRMLFMKRKSRQARKKGFSMSVKKILDNIMFFGQNGQVTGFTYFQKLSNNKKTNTKILATFEKNLIFVLEELKKYESISDYKILQKTFTKNEMIKEEAKITTKNYKNRDLQIYLKF